MTTNLRLPSSFVYIRKIGIISILVKLVKIYGSELLFNCFIVF